MEELVKMQDSLHGIRMKINIADPSYTHPLLHLWKDAGSIQSVIKQSGFKLDDKESNKSQTQAELSTDTKSIKIEVTNQTPEEQMDTNTGSY